MKNAFRDLLAKNPEEAEILFVGLPYDKGCSCGVGAHLAPQTIRELSAFLPPFSMDGESIQKMKIYDYGDIIECNDYYTAVEKQIEKIYQKNKFHLFIGGDHSVSIPLQKVFKNFVEKEGKIPVIIHIDAHPDICDFYDGSNYSHACTNKRALDHGFQSEHINLIGIRGYEEQEVEFLNHHPEILVFKASDLNQNGYSKMMETLLSKYQNDCYAIYLSYDIDANDPCYAPGTGTPEAFGLNSRELLSMLCTFFSKLPIVAMDIVEISPQLDNNNITSWLALKTLYEIFKILKSKKKD